MAGSAALGGVVGLLTATSRLVGAAWGLLVGIGAGWAAATMVGAILRTRGVGKPSA
ncbi:MAG: hypothetical protein ACYCO3_11550 [Mycobacteriales bacterium]